MRYLLVDGHSMIFAWDDLRQMHARKTESGRDELAKRLTRYQDSSGDRVVLVFDGRNSAKHQSSGDVFTIQIIYSKSGSTADDVIERLVATYAKKYDIVVATNDNMERQTVTSFGATWISAMELHTLLESEERNLQRRLKRRG